MTLLISEVSVAGIAMISDTMIRWVNKNTGIIDTAILPKYQKKLFRLPKLGTFQHDGAISYWGSFGLMIEDRNEFESWISDVVLGTQASSLSAFARELADAANALCKGRAVNQPVGFHVVGYEAWEDVVPRPKFLHVHNGHLHNKLHLESKGINATAPTGSANRDNPETYDEGLRRNMVANRSTQEKIQTTPVMEERKLFDVYYDFPNAKNTRDENLALLESGYLTSNGDYVSLTLEREVETLRQQQGKRPLSKKPRDTGYLEERTEWMVDAASRLEADYPIEQKSFGGPYQRLAFNSTETKVSAGPGLDSGEPLITF